VNEEAYFLIERPYLGYSTIRLFLVVGVYDYGTENAGYESFNDPQKQLG
jgi:hypothetical protein